MERVKAHLAAVSVPTADLAAVRQRVREQVQAHIEKSAKGNTKSAAAAPRVDDKLVDTVLSMSAVDVVALQNNKPSTGHIGVMMYVDDQGKAKVGWP
jgi:hypothetical protein